MRFQLLLAVSFLALASCETTSTGSHNLEGEAHSDAYLSIAYDPAAPQGIARSGADMVILELQPGVTPAPQTAYAIGFDIPASCGTFLSACQFDYAGTTYVCSWWDKGTKTILECNFQSREGFPKRMTFMPDGRYNMDYAEFSGRSENDNKDIFRSGTWYQSSQQFEDRTPLWSSMTSVYNQEKGLQQAQAAAEQRRANERLLANTNAILAGVAAGLAGSTSTGASGGLRPDCDCPTGNANDCSDELSGLQPIEEYCR